jgi:MYXO-CTERM domain-containing protein
MGAIQSPVLALVLVLAIGPTLEVPWPCGESYPCTQGNSGQTSHTGLAQYAWDFGMPLGADVLAARGGVVLMIEVDSQFGGCSHVYANDANYVLIDHQDGTAGLYLHVEGNSSNLQMGDPVAAGDVIARVGQTGWTCGPHLHFQVQEICGSWWCQSVPAEFYGAGAIAGSEQVESENCGPCAATLDGGQTTIAETDVPCFDRLTKWWWHGSEGLDGHHWYTYATAAAQPETIGRWRFSVATPGEYAVEVHVPEGTSQSIGTRYLVHHEGGVAEVALDQSVQKGWQPLGSFYFVAGDEQSIELPDNTGEPEDQMIPIGFDSVRFTYVEGGDGDGDPGDGDGDGDPSDGDPGDGDGDCPVGQLGCMCTNGGGCDPGAICVDGICAPDGSADEGTDETVGDETIGAEPALGPREEAGCACSSRSDPRGPLFGLLALIGLGHAHRRRR